MDTCGTLEDLKAKQTSYDEVWRNFVKFHEEYVECLQVLGYMEELERARMSYQEQMERKLTFDTEIESWKSEAMKRKQAVKTPSRKSSRSRASRSSS